MPGVMLALRFIYAVFIENRIEKREEKKKKPGSKSEYMENKGDKEKKINVRPVVDRAAILFTFN